jgi:hypothetical protein
LAIDAKQIDNELGDGESVMTLLKKLVDGAPKDIVKAEPDVAHMFLQSETKFAKDDMPKAKMPNIGKTAVVTLSDGTTREFDIEFEYIWTAANNNPKPVYHAAPGAQLTYNTRALSDKYGAYIEPTWYLKIPNVVPCGITDSHGLASGTARIYSSDAKVPTE